MSEAPHPTEVRLRLIEAAANMIAASYRDGAKFGHSPDADEVQRMVDAWEDRMREDGAVIQKLCIGEGALRKMGGVLAAWIGHGLPAKAHDPLGPVVRIAIDPRSTVPVLVELFRAAGVEVIRAPDADEEGHC